MKRILSIALIALFAIHSPIAVYCNDHDPEDYKPYQPADKNGSVKDTLRVAFGVGFLTVAMFTGHKWWDSVHQGTKAIEVNNEKIAEASTNFFVAKAKSWWNWSNDNTSIAPKPDMKNGGMHYAQACGWGIATAGSTIAGITLILQGLHIIRK